MIREVLKTDGRLAAVRAVRAFTSLSFKSAVAMVDEVRTDARWYRRIGRGGL